MNTRNLTQIFDNYISRFDWLNEPEPDGNDENYKWRAVREFQDAFDLEADNFGDMLRQARVASVNLTDSYIQPFYGLVVMAEQDGEAEHIREMFRRLYVDDGNDLQIRQEKIDDFLADAEKMVEKHYPGSFLYKNDQRAVMGYLWLRDPDHHYLAKNSEAEYLANAAEFYDDWGPYNDFKLPVYHRFCDELVEEMRQYAPLMETHKSRFIGHENDMDPDNNLHILAFDMIYCTGRYGLYDGVEIKSHTAKDKELYRTRKQKATELTEKYAAAEQALEHLQDAYAASLELFQPGMELVHRQYGSCTIQTYDGKHLAVAIGKSGEEKTFGMAVVVGNGLIRAEDEKFQKFVEQYRLTLKDAQSIEQRAEIAARALEPYKEFVK